MKMNLSESILRNIKETYEVGGVSTDKVIKALKDLQNNLDDIAFSYFDEGDSDIAQPLYRLYKIKSPLVQDYLVDDDLGFAYPDVGEILYTGEVDNLEIKVYGPMFITYDKSGMLGFDHRISVMLLPDGQADYDLVLGSNDITSLPEVIRDAEEEKDTETVDKLKDMSLKLLSVKHQIISACVDKCEEIRRKFIDEAFKISEEHKKEVANKQRQTAKALNPIK